MNRLIVLAALVAASSAPLAQVHRCNTPKGPVYQQTPCETGDGRVVVKAPEAAGPLPPDGPGKDLCIAQAPRFFKDPESVRVGVIARSGPLPLTGKDGPVLTANYAMMINAKNSFGGYAGEKLYRCYVNKDETKVILIE